MQSDIEHDRISIHSDNIALARWLQSEIESFLYPPFADPSIPVTEATFEKWGENQAYWTESITSEDDSIRLTWYDFAEPFMLTVAAGSVEGRPHGVYSCFIPARQAQLTLNGNVAAGQVFRQDRDGKECTTACIAWSETWVRP